MTCIPEIDVDIYDDEHILEPYGTYSELRGLGPVVHMPMHGLYALSRYADVRKAAIDFRLFSSASGVAANEMVNNFRVAHDVSTTISSDPPRHSQLRKIIAAPLLPTELESIRSAIQTAADELVDRLVQQGSFDGATDFARHLPLLIVSRLVGLPEEGRQNMLDWAAATFDVLGPMNERAQTALPKVGEMLAYISEHAKPDMVEPGSWAARLYDAAAADIVSMPQAIAMMIDYLGPSLDTTIFATGHLLMLLAQNPDQWEAVRGDPTLAENAIEECVRLESPIRGFTRLTTEDCEIDGVPLAAGSRTLLLYASANRDERRWHDPEAFDVRRDTRSHLGFGAGRHACAGMHLAKLEIASLLRSMIGRVRRFEADAPVRAINNLLRGLDSLPIRIVETV
jgi:cytochrome P450